MKHGLLQMLITQADGSTSSQIRQVPLNQRMGNYYLKLPLLVVLTQALVGFRI